jgi:hypothetical protein
MTPIITTMTPSAATLIVPKRFCHWLLLLIPNHLGSNYKPVKGIADWSRHPHRLGLSLMLQRLSNMRQEIGHETV